MLFLYPIGSRYDKFRKIYTISIHFHLVSLFGPEYTHPLSLYPKAAGKINMCIISSCFVFQKPKDWRNGEVFSQRVSFVGWWFGCNIHLPGKDEWVQIDRENWVGYGMIGLHPWKWTWMCLRWLFTFYYGKSLSNHHLGWDSLLFTITSSKSKWIGAISKGKAHDFQLIFFWGDMLVFWGVGQGMIFYWRAWLAIFGNIDCCSQTHWEYI